MIFLGPEHKSNNPLTSFVHTVDTCMHIKKDKVCDVHKGKLILKSFLSEVLCDKKASVQAVTIY